MPTNPIIQMLMNRLQAKNPQGFQAVNTLMQNNGDPKAMIQQLISNATPEQKENLLNQAKNYRLPR